MKFLIVFTILVTIAISVPLTKDALKWKRASREERTAMFAAATYIVSALIVMAYAATMAFQK